MAEQRENVGRRPAAEARESLIENVIRVGALAAIVYWTYLIARPFAGIIFWSAVLTIALYPVFLWVSRELGGRPRIAAVLITAGTIIVVLLPLMWLAATFVGSARELAHFFDLDNIRVGQPPESLKQWFLVGEPLYRAWRMASDNFKDALQAGLVYLAPIGRSALRVAAEAGVEIALFFVAIIVAGFLYPRGEKIASSARQLGWKLASERGVRLVELAAKTVRTVSIGVVGVAILQALLVGIGLFVIGVPWAGLFAAAVLVLCILQIPLILLVLPLIVWIFWEMPLAKAVFALLYLVPVTLLDNVLRPLLVSRGLRTPLSVIFVGLIGGALAFGFAGLFVGPITLAVIWELANEWIEEDEAPS